MCLFPFLFPPNPPNPAVAKYQTPKGTEIDHRGIIPDRACRIPMLASAPPLRASPSAPPNLNNFKLPVAQADNVQEAAGYTFVPGACLALLFCCAMRCYAMLGMLQGAAAAIAWSPCLFGYIH